VDARNRDELLKKQESLEAYLLENPRSSLFAWYARQNMEAGEIERALQICKLGLMSVQETGVLHKLLGEIYMAKGEITQSMKHLVKCILTREPFPGVIIEVIKNLGDTMEADQLTFLVHLLNKALPGHPETTKYYKKFPAARDFHVQPGQYKLLEQLAESLERSAMVEVLPVDEEDEMAMPELEASVPAPEPPAAARL
jgi:tetratricopeptide (TPR) repeat protein